MATISGSILFDKERTADAPQGLPGIANVPVILQNTATNAALAVLTDSAGHYTFTNVPDGDYRIVEAYGAAASASPGDFQTAAATNPAAAAFPPVSAAPDAPASATNLDATTPATLVVRISGSDMQGLNILNGPVRYTPIRAISDTGLSIDPKNLIDRPGYADFGSFPPGTPANTGADPNPYPDIGSGFVYTLPGNVQVTPAFHEYTIQNLMNNSIPNIQYTWWRVADHTTGNETGRMMVINGDVPGSVIYEQQVSVKPDTFYLFSSWILNLSRSVTLADPKLGVQVLNGSGQVLYSATLGELIPMNPENPEWKQIGTVINSGSNSALTVRFTSMGPEANGNDYAIDDIALNEVDVEAYTPGKSSNKSTAGIGETVEYSVTLKNTGINPLTNVTVRDAVPDGFTFVPGSVVVNGILESNANPGTGLPVPDIPGGGNLTVTFLARADRIPAVNPAVNSAAVTYSYSPVNGGIPDVYNRTTNPVSIRILQADISVTKTSYPNPVQAGTRITYTVSVVNNGPTEAQSVVLTDTPPEAIENPEYSSDGGETWQAWGGSLALGDMASNARRDVIIRGKVSNSAAGSLINTAIAASPTPDPNPDNNTVTEITPVITSADVSITKKADKNPAEAGGVLTYTLTITNNGPNDAQNVVVTDNVPAALTAAEYSSDGGVSWNPWGGSLALGTAPSGAALEIRLRGTVSGAAAGSISNTAAVTSSTPDPNPDNNRTTVDIPVVVPYIPKADVSVTKKADKSSVQAGDMLTYTLTVTNGGPDTAQNVVLNDVIPPAMSAAEYSANDGVNWVPLNGPLALGNMNSGAEYKILIHGTVDKAATGQIVNTASVSSSTADPNPGGNTVSVITPIVTPPIIVPPPPPTSSAYVSVIKTANKTSAAPCEQVIYTITVSNAGPSEAEETALTDIMPRELLSAVYSTDSGTTWNTWNGSLTLGTLPAGARIVILIKALIIPGDACYISNVAEISSKTADSSPAPGSKRSEAVVAVKRSHCCGSGLQMPARGRNGYATAWWS